MAQQRDQACGKLDHAHDSLRLDGTLDNCCLRCGADGYWHDGRRLDEPHPSGKLLFRLGMLRPGFADFTLGELLLLGLWVIGQEDRVDHGLMPEYRGLSARLQVAVQRKVVDSAMPELPRPSNSERHLRAASLTEVDTADESGTRIRYPSLLWFEREFGTRVRTDSPNPLSVWRAELHDVRDGYAFRLLCTGVSEGDALDRLDKLIAEIRGADA
jgi:hypothetical protein